MTSHNASLAGQTAREGKEGALSRLFESYLAVDWSARSTPSPLRPTKDAIWVGEALAPGLEDTPFAEESYWQTRSACAAYVRDRLVHHVQLKRRVFLGCDFAYGYPTGFAKALGLTSDLPAWRRIWDEVARLLSDDEDNHNNRFDVAAEFNRRCGSLPGPFWGCSRNARLPTLSSTSPAQGYPYRVASDLALERLRWADHQAKGVQPVWKLMGKGSVGGQSIVGIPMVRRLRDDPLLQAVSRIWPFETGLLSYPTPTAGPSVLHGKIWPGVVHGALDPSLAIRDQAQVRAVVQWLRDLDTQDQLGGYFAPAANLSPEILRACVEEEGWILGTGHALHTQSV